MRRVLRIWPLYYVIVFVVFIIYPLLHSVGFIQNDLSDTHSNLFFYLALLGNFDWLRVNQQFPYVHQSLPKSTLWSIAVEEQFYVFWPVLFAFLPKRSWGYLISSVIILSIAFRMINHKDVSILYAHTLSVLLDLGIGGLMAYLIKTNKSIRGFFESASGNTHLLFFLFSFVLLYYNPWSFKYAYGNAAMRIFISFSFALIIAAQAMTLKDTPLNLGKFSFASRWGKYTYGIYLIHPLVITAVNVPLHRIPDSFYQTLIGHHIPYVKFLIPFSFGLLAAPLTLLVSWVSYEYFESKFLVLKGKLEVIKTYH